MTLPKDSSSELPLVPEGTHVFTRTELDPELRSENDPEPGDRFTRLSFVINHIAPRTAEAIGATTFEGYLGVFDEHIEVLRAQGIEVPGYKWMRYPYRERLEFEPNQTLLEGHIGYQKEAIDPSIPTGITSPEGFALAVEVTNMGGHETISAKADSASIVIPRVIKYVQSDVVRDSRVVLSEALLVSQNYAMRNNASGTPAMYDMDASMRMFGTPDDFEMFGYLQ